MPRTVLSRDFCNSVGESKKERREKRRRKKRKKGKGRRKEGKNYTKMVRDDFVVLHISIFYIFIFLKNFYRK